MSNESYIVSVADAIGLDATNGNLLFIGKANITSAFTISTQKTEVRGGKNNPIRYTFYHDKAVEVTIESACFQKEFLALNAGTKIENGIVNVSKMEAIKLTAGVGTLSETPVGNVGVMLPNGTIQNITPNGKSITISGGGDQEITAVYTYTEAGVDYITGFSANPPTGIHLILMADERDNAGTKISDVIIDVPAFNISGNYTLSFAANGVSQDSLNGQAAVTSDANGDYYYKSFFVPTEVASAQGYSDIAATPGMVTFSEASLPDTSQLTVLGIRNGLFSNVNITSQCTFSASGVDTDVLWVSASGLISACATAQAGDTITVTADYWDSASGSLVDTAIVSVTA